MVVVDKYYRYGNDPRNLVKRYYLKNNQTTSKKRNVYIFIHGGAWRDPSNSCDDFDEFARYIYKNAIEKNQYDVEVFSIDYRLSPANRYPSFLNDIIKAILKIFEILDIRKGSEMSEILNKVSICGHSVGSTLALQLLNTEGSNNTDFMNKQQELLTKVFLKDYLTNLILLDGIYDLKLMIDEYPEYQGFVEEAHESLEDAFKSTEFLSFEHSKNIKPKILIIHSKQDELLSLKQPDQFIERYKRNFYISHIYGDFGKHNDVYISEKVCSLIIQEMQET